MIEYIFGVPDSNQPIAGESALYYPDERDEPMAVGEEIVRCRDCANYSGEDSAVYPRWCMAMNITEVEPDGFCAWPERMED